MRFLAVVTALLPTDGEQYEQGTSVTLKRPTTTSVATADGTWEFVGYPQPTITVGNANVTATGTWRFVPKPKGSIIVKFVDAAGTTLKTETPVSNVVEGTAYDVTASATPTIQVNGKTYNYKGLQAGSPAAAGNVAAGNTTVVFEYEEDTTVLPVARVSGVVKSVDENGVELKVYKNTLYDVSDLAEAEITINGKIYTFDAVIVGSLVGVMLWLVIMILY